MTALPAHQTRDWIDDWRRALDDARPLLERAHGLRRLWLIGGRPPAPPPDVHLLADFDRGLDYGRLIETQEALGRLLGVKVEVVVRGALDAEIEALIAPALIALL